MNPSRELRRYFAGLFATFVGAWATEVTESMLPLALGASVTVMCTVPLVRRLWGRRRS
jgi:hypothetical protein